MKTPTLKSLIEKRKFDWTNSSITEEVFPIEIRKHKGYKLFHFNRYISSEDVVKEMLAEGYSPANIAELLLWKDWNDRDWVVALGSVGKVDGSRYVPRLHEGGSERYLYLDYWDLDWDSDGRFLAVRNLSLKTSDTLKSFDPRILGLLETAEKAIAEAKELLK